MTLLPDTLISLAAQGAALRVSAREISQNQLNQLAAAITEGGGKLTITQANSLTPQQAASLVAVAGGHVEFDLTA